MLLKKESIKRSYINENSFVTSAYIVVESVRAVDDVSTYSRREIKNTKERDQVWEHVVPCYPDVLESSVQSFISQPQSYCPAIEHVIPLRY